MRKQEIVKVPEDWGASVALYRDFGKHFLITEWPAARAEKWALRAMIAYNRGGGQIPVDAIGGGMKSIFFLGLNTFLRGQMQADEVLPILDELMECVKIVRDPKSRGVDGKVVATDLVSDDDIEEIKTRLWLRSEVVRVHTNFSPAEMLSNLISAMMAEGGSNQQTSPDRSPTP